MSQCDVLLLALAGKERFEISGDDSIQRIFFGTARPVDILEMPDGSLLVSDDEAGVIYRITYRATG